MSGRWDWSRPLRCAAIVLLVTGAVGPVATAAAQTEDLLVDEESGETYRLAEVPRIEGTYEFLDEERTEVRLRFGLVARVERLDEESIWIRVYETQRRSAAPTPTPAVPEVVDLETTEDRLIWAPADSGLPRSGLWREGFDFGDFDGDGRLDLVLPPPRKSSAGSRPLVFLRRGPGEWTRWNEVSFPDQVYDYGDVAVLDFDRDGRLDLALGMHLRGVQLLRGSEGGFETVEFPPDGPFEARSVEAFEWGGELVLVAFGEGMSAGSARQETEAARSTPNRGVRAWRFEDGKARPIERDPGAELSFGFGDEIAFGRPAGDVRMLALGSRRALARGMVARLREDGPSPVLGAVSLPLPRDRGFHAAVAFADTDADGSDELYFAVQSTVGAQRWNHLDAYRLVERDGEVHWSGETLLSRPSDTVVWSMAGGDLDGDGREDLVAGTGDGELLVFLADVGGRLRRDLSPGLPAPRRGCVVREVDVRDHGDGAVEVTALFAGETGRDRLGVPTARVGCENGGRVAVWRVTPTRARVEPGALD